MESLPSPAGTVSSAVVVRGDLFAYSTLTLWPQFSLRITVDGVTKMSLAVRAVVGIGGQTTVTRSWAVLIDDVDWTVDHELALDMRVDANPACCEADNFTWEVWGH